jgi:hypothetical protein
VDTSTLVGSASKPRCNPAAGRRAARPPLVTCPLLVVLICVVRLTTGWGAAAGQALDAVAAPRVSTSAATATIEIRLTDHREAIGDFASVALALTEVTVHEAAAPAREGWRALPLAQPQVEVTKLTDGRAVTVARGEVPGTRYDGVRLTGQVTAARLKDGRVVAVTAALRAVRIDLVAGAGVSAAVSVDLVLLDLSDHAGQAYTLRVREARVETAAPGAPAGRVRS